VFQLRDQVVPTHQVEGLGDVKFKEQRRCLVPMEFPGEAAHVKKIMSKVHHRSTNFLSCVIPVHKLLKCVIVVMLYLNSI
jgi:hypothetical protein